MKKTILAIIIGIAIIAAMFLTKNLWEYQNIVKKIDWTVIDKTSFNYNELIEDIKSVENKKDFKYAKEVSSNQAFTKSYKGEGYLINASLMADATKYTFMTNDNQLIYETTLSSWSEPESVLSSFFKTDNLFYVLVIIVIIVDIIICIRIKKKEQ